MKRASSNKRIAIALAILSGAAMTSCGSSNNNAAIAGVVPGAVSAGGCAAGIPIAVGNTPSPIGFSGTNVVFTGINLFAGAVPGSASSYGQVTVGAGGAGGFYSSQSVDGTISMNLTPTYAGAAPVVGQPYQPPIGQTATAANMTGVLTLNPLTISDIYNQFGGYGGYGTTGYGGTGYGGVGYGGTGYNPYLPTPTIGTQVGPCVSGMAMSMGWSGTSHAFYNSQVYLYINGTAHGYVVIF